MKYAFLMKNLFKTLAVVVIVFIYNIHIVSASDTTFVSPTVHTNFVSPNVNTTFVSPTVHTNFVSPNVTTNFVSPTSNSGFVSASRTSDNSSNISINTPSTINTSVTRNTNYNSRFSYYPSSSYYGGFSGYTSAYSYGGGGSTHTPTWKPNTAGWTTDYQLGYSTAENPAVTGDNSWNPDVNSWNTDYALTYSTSHNDNYRVTCIVDDTTVDADDEVEFHAKVTGGKGDYEYEWFGDDGIDEDDDSFEHEFDRNGIYRVTVEVTDEDGFTTYDECDAVYVGRDYYTANYVQDYYTGSPQGELASQNSVYLSQVPYTGAEDVAKIFGFVALIAVWSIVIAYYFIKRKHKNTISNRIADFKKANLAARA